MFNLFKSKGKFVISAPISGILTKLEDVNDQVFSTKMMGDGFAVKPATGENIIMAPVSGKIVSLPSTHHALGIVAVSNVEVLLHVGIDTVSLNGKGFEVFVSEGQRVERGEKLLKYDEQIMKAAKLDMTVMTILTAGYDQKIDLNDWYGNKVTPAEILIS